MNIISHVRQSDFAIQTNDEHQHGVARLAEAFAANFGMGEWGKVLGLLHDKGKEKKAFQQHIKKESGLDPNARVNEDYRHAYVGAVVAKLLFPQFAPLMTNPLAGHHRGLYDEVDLYEVIKSEVPKEVKLESITAKLDIPKDIQPKDIHHIQRFLFSCLVDADYLDTEHFMLPEQHNLRKSNYDLKVLDNKLTDYLQSLSENAPETFVNKVRKEVLEWCNQASQNKSGFYSLTVPTGGGKTLSSMSWALKHAIKNNLNRIIIAIPYTSIIVQTASVLQSIFGEENVLEHHSVINDINDNDEISQIKKLAIENWDYPIIVTTNVQLFESLFSNRPSDCRKLHNIANSVIILDEVQTLPVNSLLPIVDTLDTLKRVFRVSLLFTTASQPLLSGRIIGTNKLMSFDALPEINEIIPEGLNLHQRLKRTTLHFDAEGKTYNEIANQLSQHKNVLCIVNTRKDAKEIYCHLPMEGKRLHLSRMMCPKHIKTVLNEIKFLLMSGIEEPIRVVATQLIEAGVDIDFPVVFRQEAGLDSILQAAGRCNREGKQSMGHTYVFSFDKPLPHGLITQNNNARLALGKDMDWFSPKTMLAYFLQLYSRVDDFDKSKIKELLYKQDIQFETAANKFQLIENDTFSVIVNWENSMDLVGQLKENGVTYSLMKRLAQYSVNIRQSDFKQLQQVGAIEDILESVYVISNPSFYDKEVGLITTNQWLEETLIL